MVKILNIIRSITIVTSYLGFGVLIFMMLFLTVASIFRSFDNPILGDIEITSLSMVVLIVLAISYTQSIDGHIKIGILADRLPTGFQKFLDVISSILTFVVAVIIAVVYYNTSMRYLEFPMYSELLKIPLYPFKFLILFSSVLWALECIIKLIQDLMGIEVKHSRLFGGDEHISNSY